MEKHKVLILIDRLGRGGVAQVAINTAVSLDRSKYFPIVCTTRSAQMHGQDQILKKSGIPLIQLERTSAGQILHWRKLWQIMPTISIVHSHQSGSNLWGRIWGNLYRVPIIITQDHTAADEKKKSQHILDRLLSPLSNHIVTVSEYDRNLSIKLEKLPPNKVTAIYNGIDIVKFPNELTKEEARKQANLPSNKRLIAIIARLAPQKNHRNLIESLTCLPKEFLDNTQCLIIGSGHLEDQLYQQVQELGLNDNVVFLGERTDVPIILRAIDLLVLPSYWECLPIILLEALASGCPIVATPVGGVPEVMEGIDWPLVDPDNPDALAEAMISVSQKSPEEREKIAQRGRNIVLEKFSKEASVTRVEELYRTLLVNH